MEDLEEEDGFIKRSPESRKGFVEKDVNSRTPLKKLNQIGSPLKVKKKLGDKENKGSRVNDPKPMLKLSYPAKSTTIEAFDGDNS